MHHRWTKGSIIMSLQAERIYFHAMYLYCLANYLLVPSVHRVCLMQCFFVFLMSCLKRSIMVHFWRTNLTLLTCSVCIISGVTGSKPGQVRFKAFEHRHWRELGKRLV